MNYEETGYDIFCKTEPDKEFHVDIVKNSVTPSHEQYIFERDVYDRSDFLLAKSKMEKFIELINAQSIDSVPVVNIYEGAPTYVSTVFCQVMDTNGMNYIRHIFNLGVREVTLPIMNTPTGINEAFRGIKFINLKSYIDDSLIDIEDFIDLPMSVYVITALNERFNICNSMLIMLREDAENIYSGIVAKMWNKTDPYTVCAYRFDLAEDMNYECAQTITTTTNKDE